MLKNKGRNEKGVDNIKNQECDYVFVLHDHFVESCKDKTGEGGNHCYLKRIGKIYHYILEHYLTKRS